MSNPIFSHTSEGPPSPRNLSVDLYPIESVAHAGGDSQSHQPLAETLEFPPFPTYDSIDLHPLPTLQNLVSSNIQTFTSEATNLADTTREPFPLLHFVELVSVTDTPQSRESFESDTPLSHDALLYAHGDLSTIEASTISQVIPTSRADSGEGLKVTLPSAAAVSTSEADVKSQDDADDMGPEEPFDRRQRHWIMRRDPRR
ncbi:hypothetical protein CPB83DRAFT_896301 [Crepidotus variabilis]|uniref:Uncharacterized protein n=1 Tax=Crepidotus variabilis TaxID=179855 RepID=A0A9P6EC91_9AGAR|nr:hypothetical protein CPB83DRAFT_896301 [Crepidotus variabilis]